MFLDRPGGTAGWPVVAGPLPLLRAAATEYENLENIESRPVLDCKAPLTPTLEACVDAVGHSHGPSLLFPITVAPPGEEPATNETLVGLVMFVNGGSA